MLNTTYKQLINELAAQTCILLIMLILKKSSFCSKAKHPKHPFIIEGASSTLEPYSGTFKKSQPRWTKSWTEFRLSSMIFYIIKTPLPSLSK